MKILGIDPGLRVTGYGVIAHSPAKGGSAYGGNGRSAPRFDILEAGVVRTDEKAGIAGRLRKIYAALSSLIEETQPDVLVIEKLYAHYAHPATAILMGHARGVICLLSGVHDVPLESIASTHVKKAVSGHGHAGKQQIQRMVQHTLKLRTMPEPSDVADALAIAIAYASQINGKNGS